MRSLTPDEAALWARVAATIRPLSRQPLAPPEAVKPAAQHQSPPPRVPPKAPAQTPPPLPRPGTTLDGSWDKKLKTGAVEPDRILDLHGMNLDSAWSAIDSALERAIDAGDRVLLLITGHARPDGPPVQRGRIRGRGARLACGVAACFKNRRGPRRPRPAWRRREPVHHFAPTLRPLHSLLTELN